MTQMPSPADVSPPRARVSPTRLETHGVVRVDDYYWMRERTEPEVLAYLEAENAHTKAVMAATEPLQETLFSEIKGRIKQTEMSVPYREGEYRYYTRYEDGLEYPIYCRCGLEESAAEHVLLDVNQLAQGHDFCEVSGWAISPDSRLLAYAVDFEGRRIYQVHIKSLDDGRLLDDELKALTSNLVWANDNATLFYTKQDPTTLRWHQVYRHRLGTAQQDDVLVFEESDETFICDVGKTRSKAFMLIASYQTLSTEYRLLDADHPAETPRVFLARDRGHEYQLDHYQGRFYIRSNLNATNFKLMETSDQRPEPEAWVERIPHRDGVLLGAFELFRDYLVVQERRDGLVHLRVHPWSASEAPHDIEFDEPVYDAYLSVNREPESSVLRFGYESLTVPASTYDYDMRARTRTLLKREEVLGKFDPSHYQAERLMAIAPDGESIPISLVARRGVAREVSQPLLLYGYGAYGISIDPTFNSARLSLLDRGFVFAIAHVRGGQERGRPWYDAGRLKQKEHTFTDFIACAEHLIEQGRTAPDRLFAMGGSAGGLLVGAVMNLRPDLFAGVVAQVPFVVVVTTMLDDSIPLTTGEYDEWGNPHEQEAFERMLSYSPYDNVEAKPYPSLLVMAGLHDSQVQYWEPAKWVAKLRALKTDTRPLLLKINMEAGHGGASGRYRRYRETALQYAFLLREASLA